MNTPEIVGLCLLALNPLVLMYGQFRLFKAFEAQTAREEVRQDALYRQQKGIAKDIQRDAAASREVVAQARLIHEDTRLLQDRVDGHFAHPAVKRLTAERSD